jgi:translation initiation factor IF-2
MGLFSWLASLFGHRRNLKHASRAELEKFIQTTQQLITQKTYQRDYLRGEIESLRQEIRFLEQRIRQGELGELTEEDVMERILDREHILNLKVADADDLTEAIQGLALEVRLVQRELNDRALVHLDEDQLRELSISRKRRQDEREERSRQLDTLSQFSSDDRQNEIKRRLAQLKDEQHGEAAEPAPPPEEPTARKERTPEPE